MLAHVETLWKIAWNGLQSGDRNCICIDVKVLAGLVTQAIISSAEGWDAPAVRVASLPPPASGQLPKYEFHIRFANTGQIGRDCPGVCSLRGATCLFGVRRLPGAHYLPGSRCPPKIAPSLGLSTGTVWPPLDLLGHIESPSSAIAAMSYTASAGTDTPLGKITNTAQQMVGQRYFHCRLFSQRMEAHTATPSISPLAAQPLPISVAATWARFGGWVYKSKRCF